MIIIVMMACQHTVSTMTSASSVQVNFTLSFVSCKTSFFCTYQVIHLGKVAAKTERRKLKEKKGASHNTTEMIKTGKASASAHLIFFIFSSCSLSPAFSFLPLVLHHLPLMWFVVPMTLIINTFFSPPVFLISYNNLDSLATSIRSRVEHGQNECGPFFLLQKTPSSISSNTLSHWIGFQLRLLLLLLLPSEEIRFIFSPVKTSLSPCRSLNLSLLPSYVL